MELYEAEAPTPDDCAVLDTVRLGAEPGGRLGPSTLSTAPKNRDTSCKLKWPNLSG